MKLCYIWPVNETGIFPDNITILAQDIKPNIEIPLAQ